MTKVVYRSALFIGSTILFSSSLLFMGLALDQASEVFSWVALIILNVSGIFMITLGYGMFKESNPELIKKVNDHINGNDIKDK